MTRRSGTRQARDLRRIEARRTAQAQEVIQDSPLFYRLVTGRSIADLNGATLGLSKKVDRVLDHFVLPLAYNHQIDGVRRESLLSDPPTNAAVAQKFGELSVRSLGDAKTVDVLGVEPRAGKLEVQVDYSELIEEEFLLAAAARELLLVSADFEFKLGAHEPAITIITGGKLSPEAISGIAARVPDHLTVSPAIPFRP